MKTNLNPLKVALILIFFLSLKMNFEETNKIRSLLIPCQKPWGAMYIPIESGAQEYGITGTFISARPPNFSHLVADLEKAKKHGVKLIVTLGTTNPCLFYDKSSQTFNTLLYYSSEVAPFFVNMETRRALQEAITEGTIWGFRLLDEPHDREDCIDQTVVGDVMTYHHAMNPQELAALFNLLFLDLQGIYEFSNSNDENFVQVKVGTTSPPDYMLKVRFSTSSSNLFSSVQYRWPNATPVYDFFTTWGEYAVKNNISLVGSLNSSSSLVDDLTFFDTMSWLCGYQRVDFVTAWDWNRVSIAGAKSFQQRADDLKNKNYLRWLALLLKCRFCF